MHLLIFTARKRSLRRLCFYRCLSVHGGGHAWLLAGGVCVVAPRGACMVAPGGVRGCSWGDMHGCSQGGMHGCSQGEHVWLLWGACVVAPGGHAWLLWGACVVAPGGHAWLLPGGHAWLLLGGHAWLLLGGHAWLLWGGHVWFFRWDTVNERAVRILLECILVFKALLFYHEMLHYSRNIVENCWINICMNMVTNNRVATFTLYWFWIKAIRLYKSTRCKHIVNILIIFSTWQRLFTRWPQSIVGSLSHSPSNIF